MSKHTVQPENEETIAINDVVADRRDRPERRRRAERRRKAVPVTLDRRQDERRLGERRRQIDPTTCEREYDGDEIEFMKAMDVYKRQFCRPFPTWSEVLEVLKSLGYRKVADPSIIPLKREKLSSAIPEEL